MAIMFYKDPQQFYKREFPLCPPVLRTSSAEITQPAGNLFCAYF
jgi:hypothetical protein